MTVGVAPVNGGRLAYEVEGEGPGLVLVHAGVCDRRMWDGVWPALTARHRVVRYDARGFGESGPARASFSPRADLVALLDHHGIGRAALCGVSFGGRIALETALEYPDRIGALALVCCAVDWDDAPDELRERIEEADEAGEEGDVERAVELELRIWLDGDGRAGPLDPVLRESVRAMNLRAWGLALESTGSAERLMPPASTRLGSVGVPTLVIAGEYDVPFMTESCRSLAVAVPRARFELLDGVAHLPPLERPDLFAPLLLDFLGSVSAAGGLRHS
ncbi:MAG TPA: alpha/beta fold hydrolase [Gaiellaceae bacterium]|nr:alpha/beta fold hydrolase [Gaiellaceae bacterium]